MIRVLCTDISAADVQIYKRLYEKATEERRRRADRYLRQEDKLRCVTADALLRYALGTSDYRIEKNEFGKPYVKNRRDFYYNLSHSGKYVVIAFGDTEVGVDIQEHLADTDIRAIAERFFSEAERRDLGEDAAQRTARFYEIWTGKESYLKYLGRGLHTDMRTVDVSVWKREIRLLHPEKGYSLSLCTAARDYTFALSDIRQL
ncbi:MAG: 4'-phosphopantetheinyl transferase superfamily protein [Clostridia bacterium]|nr:4'-phosphopantetheinyl transferase superfamily protein [Clostridia bacterium]